MAYGDVKDLIRRTASEKKLRDKEFNTAKNPKYHGYQRGFASVDYQFLIERLLLVTLKISWIAEELAEELHKPVIRKL